MNMISFLYISISIVHGLMKHVMHVINCAALNSWNGPEHEAR